MRSRPDYGVDGPIAVTILLILGGVLLGTAFTLAGLGIPRLFGIGLGAAALVVGADLLAIAFGLLGYSKLGKRLLRDRLLDRIPWRGDEAVLDVGCGRGLFLIGTARRLTTGTSTGIDLWRKDLSGNHPGAVIENARLEGVADRVSVTHGDAQRLPFADASFDVVVSGLVLHNLREHHRREQAVREIARVLKPGGHVLLLDLRFTSEYAHLLRQAGVSDVRRQTAWRVFSPVIRLVSWGLVHFCWVTGQKAPRAPLAGQASAGHAVAKAAG
jgi:SAM-dependent methyltransferase